MHSSVKNGQQTYPFISGHFWSAMQCIALVLLHVHAPSATAQNVSAELNDVISSEECRMLIHLGNQGLIMNHGAPDFSRSGDVWLHCPDHSVPLTQTSDIFSFALFPDGSRMAVVRHLNRNARSDAPALLEEVDLKTGKTLKKEQLPMRLFGYEVVSTCGTVLLLGNQMRKRQPGEKVSPVLETEVVDLITDKHVDNVNYNSIRCTADRSVVLRKRGPTHVSLGTLMIGNTDDNVLAREKVGDFNVSNSGRFIAYTAGSSVCISEPATPAKVANCVDKFWDRGRLDVSDDGKVWLTGDSLQSCPGKEHVNLPTWTCDAIFAWDGKQEAPRLAAYGYVDPFGISLQLGQRIMSLVNDWKGMTGDSRPPVGALHSRPIVTTNL